MNEESFGKRGGEREAFWCTSFPPNFKLTALSSKPGKNAKKKKSKKKKIEL
jgi:hypothetical protein